MRFPNDQQGNDESRFKLTAARDPNSIQLVEIAFHLVE
jgi:hypothetical protein